MGFEITGWIKCLIKKCGEGSDLKICIVTVYDSVNSGSYWQAYALGHVLKGMGHQICYLQRKKKGGASSSVRSQIISFSKVFLKSGASCSFRYLQSLYGFKKAKKKFGIIKNKKAKIDKIDIFILGSDTIWNLDSKHFKCNYKIYWGIEFSKKKVFPYAASVANTSKKVFDSLLELAPATESWTNIGVRDEYTYNIISSMTSRPIDIVCDPTLLLRIPDYKAMVDLPIVGEYIFLYLFRDLTNEESIKLKNFALKNNLEVIQCFTKFRCKSADRVVVNSPDIFLRHMLSAKYVITDTFHGSVFSINLQKQFIVIGRSKNKVNDLLYRLEFEDRLVDENGDIVSALYKRIDYKERYIKVEDFRNDSLLFLKNAIGE